MVGLGLFDQQIPFAMISLPPSFNMMPPLAAVLFVIDVIGFVLAIGREAGNVVKFISFPYSVPNSVIA